MCWCRSISIRPDDIYGECPASAPFQYDVNLFLLRWSTMGRSRPGRRMIFRPMSDTRRPAVEFFLPIVGNLRFDIELLLPRCRAAFRTISNDFRSDVGPLSVRCRAISFRVSGHFRPHVESRCFLSDDRLFLAGRRFVLLQWLADSSRWRVYRNRLTIFIRHLSSD